MPNHDRLNNSNNQSSVNHLGQTDSAEQAGVNSDLGVATNINTTPGDETTTPAYATATPSLTKRPKLIPNRGRALLWYLLSLVVVGFDQWTKWLAEVKLNFHDPVAVIEPILNWTLAYNYGAAFSFLADQGGWQKWFFAGLSLIMSVFLVIYLTRAPRQARLLNVGLALILGGAIGNLIDRVRIGKVIDFIHVHYADVWHYPIFNLADMAICIGVAIVVIDMLFLENKRNEKFQA